MFAFKGRDSFWFDKIGRLGVDLALGNGEWRSLVAHLLWEQDVAGSNPVSPTTDTWAPVAQLDRASAF